MKNIQTKKVLAVVLLGFMLSGFFALDAKAQQTGFQVTQKMRNLTKQNFAWVDSLQTDPQDRIEFQITIIWQGSQSTQNVLVREALAEKLVYADNLKLDGIPLSGDITKENVNTGQLGASQAKVVSFEAVVSAADLLAVGISNLINTVTVFNPDGGASTTSTVQATRTGSPTDVSTGPLSFWMIGLVLLSIAAFAGISFLFLRSYIRREVLESPYETRTDRKLAAMMGSIKKEEKKS